MNEIQRVTGERTAGTHNGVHEGVSSASPQEGAVKAIGIQVVTHTIATPLLATARVAHVTLGVGPADAQMRGQVRGLLNVVQCHLIVPPLVDGRALHLTHEDVGACTVKTRAS
ncbi:hypothetical protein E2C01_004899 [Portunus trituberculatus]|uniref:Uncharacterized protein n=1 Tax=Portunus trituberculatus TaxID=210409 RepID=A0A5B7CTK8_PORTR|nr:hypothetical protein [Portunus trituberculatus]